MKRVLGLDLGSSSIGWAVVEENSKEITSETDFAPKDKIIAMGCRIVPFNGDENNRFINGQVLTKNADRTKKRTQRKGYDRYQLRRALLLEELKRLGMYNGTTLKLSTLDLWGIRAKAVTEQISLIELGRVLCHINQKRGYRTVKSDYEDKKQGAYVKQVIERYREIHELNITIGQFLYGKLCKDSAFRCKECIYPREAYVEEFDFIMRCQKKYYPGILTNEIIAHIRNYIIFYQRPLKSCKHLVAKCELERHDRDINGRIRNCGPKVAHRSSPLFQVCKIWETINNLKIKNKNNETLSITLEQKRAIFDFMNKNEKLTVKDLKKILNIGREQWQFRNAVGVGLQGNTTYCAIAKAFDNYVDKEKYLKFDLKIINGNIVNTETSEVSKVVDRSFEEEPLYKLWHTLYSISNIEEIQRVLKKNLGINDNRVIEALCQIDFVKSGYCNKSSRAIRKILPYLQQGMQYYDAKLIAGYDNVVLCKEQNTSRELAEKLLPVRKGELRQPVVEKILNQLVNVVNALMEEYGRFDEIRVELARELKQSREERKLTKKTIDNNKKENTTIAKRIEEYGLTPTRLRIQKYKMWEETENVCIYCGKTVNVREFLLGANVEVEHIIPRSILFDDSFSNKVCSCHKCNNDKNVRTAYDFMEKRHSEGEFNAYIERVNDLVERKKISNVKRDKLLMRLEDLPTDFIERQLRESQYIAKKAKEMLQTICHNVYSTSGSVTDFIRHVWGWDEVLHSINFERYRDFGLTEKVKRDGHSASERIIGWSKRMDHRHHAVDALTIACTKQGYIQRINNLNSLKEVSFCSFSDNKQGIETRQRLSKLERYILMQTHFSTADVKQAVEGIVVSFKGGKRAASIGKRYIYKNGRSVLAQKGVIIPRGALSEESIYGCIYNSEKEKQESVIKYKIDTITLKNIDNVVDKGIQKILRDKLEHNPNNAFAEPVLDHQGHVIRSVRCYTHLNAIVPLRYNESGEPIAFVKPCNNHHVAMYEDEDGNLHEHIVTFWHAVERKKYGLPIIITNPDIVWDNISDKMPETFQEQLPKSANWKFKFSMQQNEMFILGMDEELYQDAMQNNDYAILSRFLYRVQKLSAKDYYFRHHLETTADDNSSIAKQMGKMKRLSLKSLFDNNPHKVHVSVIGKISEI